MKPEFRKVQSLMNDTSFAIVIPKEMVKKMGIVKGDTVRIVYNYAPDVNPSIEIEKVE